MTSFRANDPWIVLPPAELLVDVDVSPAPDIPLASLRGVVEPRLDDRGSIVDWALVTTAVREHGTIGEFWAWRGTWRRTWELGPVPNAAALRQYVDELDAELVPSLAGVLRSVVGDHENGVDVPWVDAHVLVDELDMVRLALSADDRTGWGIVDDMAAAGAPVGLARAWAPPITTRVLAATLTGSVQVRPNRGLVMLLGDSDDERATVVEDIREVDLRDDPVRVVTASGDRFELSAADARPLAWLVPQSLRWHVRQVPLALVWSPWFTAWPEAVEAAVGGRTALHVTSSAPMVS